MTGQEFGGKVAIVAGGSLGIGLATARRLAEGGASVALCGRRAGAVEEAVASLREDGLTVEGMAADVGSDRDVARLIAHTVERLGGVDILVNSAGIQRYGDVVETDEAAWDEVFDTNVKGMYLTAHHAIPEMRKRGGGVVVNVSSVQAFASQRSVAAYTASKGAINALTRAMAMDHAHERIRVVAVCRGRSTRRCCAPPPSCGRATGPRRRRWPGGVGCTRSDGSAPGRTWPS